ncbi:MAG: hypothetical protein AAGI89_05055, partial [Pseudomonadota bacterium]
NGVFFDKKFGQHGACFLSYVRAGAAFGPCLSQSSVISKASARMISSASPAASFFDIDRAISQR